MKTCNYCGEEKSLDAFSKDSHSKDGHRRDCKTCCAIKRSAKWREKDSRYVAGMYRRKYGITLEEYALLLQDQEGKCAICRRKAPTDNDRFSIDHDHRTGRVRGLLCNQCNTAIGLLGDDWLNLSRAAEYLLIQS